MNQFLHAKHPVVLAYMTGGWGDRLLRLPTLRALESLFPARLVLVAEPFMKDTVFCGIRCKRFCAVERLAWENNELVFDADSLADNIGECDLLISIREGARTANSKLLKVLSPRNSVGFEPDFEFSLEPNRNVHRVEFSFDIPRYLDSSLRVEDYAQPVFSDEYHERARSIRTLLPKGSKVMVVHADTKPYKMWPPDRFVEALDFFLERHPDFFCIVVGLEDLRLDRGSMSNRVIPMLNMGLIDTMAFIGQADLFLGIDSCFLHAADLFGVPGVGLFGPTSSDLFGFRFSLHRHVCAQTEIERMDAIKVSEVIEALEAVIFECNLIQTSVL